MPILRGVMSYTRFIAKSQTNFTPDDIVNKLNLFRFKPLHPHGEDKETMGWCSYLSEYEHERAIKISDFYYDNKTIITLRLDSITIPKDLLKAMVKKSLRAYQNDHNSLPDKQIKKEIELAEAKALKARIIPKTKIIEAVWYNDSGELKIFSKNKTLLDHFTNLFQQTFLIRPIRRDPAHEALKFAEVNNNLSGLESMQHQPLFLPPIRVDVN